MSRLTLAGPGHLSRLLPLVAACHDERGLASSDSRRRQALEPLLRGTPLGAVWLIGPWATPIGYVSVTFGWSLACAGRVARLDEMWLWSEDRGKGYGSQALDLLLGEVQKRGAVALQAVLPERETRLSTFLTRRGLLATSTTRLAERPL